MACIPTSNNTLRYNYVLRSKHKTYFIFFRHQAREAEPKEYDINRSHERDLCKATYKRIGNVTDGVSQTQIL